MSLFQLKKDSTDRLYSEFIKTRDEYTCQLCDQYFPEGQRQYLDTAHCFSRACKQLRWEPLNSVAMCRDCHRQMDSNDFQKKEFFRDRIGDKAFALLSDKFHNPGRFPKPDPKEIRKWLRAGIKKMIGLVYGGRA